MAGLNIFGKRRNFFINPHFQIRFILYVSVFAMVGIGVFFAVNYFFFEHMMQEGVAMALPQEHPYFYFIEEQKILLGKIFLMTAILLFLAIVIIGIFYSHKIAGPLYFMNQQMQKIANGEDVPELQFRKGDYFKELAPSFNQVRTFYQQKIANKK